MTGWRTKLQPMQSLVVRTAMKEHEFWRHIVMFCLAGASLFFWSFRVTAHDIQDLPAESLLVRD